MMLIPRGSGRAVVSMAMAVTLGAATAVLLAAPLPAAASARPACGSTITQDLRLTANLTCTGDALIVGADGITLDLGGHRVTGSGSGTGIRVSVGADIRIEHGTIANFSTGVDLLPGPVNPRGIALSRLRLIGNDIGVNATANGMQISRSVLVDNRLAVRSRHGLATLITDSRVVNGDIVLGTTGFPAVSHTVMVNGTMTVTETNDAVLADNTLVNYPVNVTFSHRPTIENNTFRSAGTAGLSLGASDNMIVTGNRFARNEVGLSAMFEVSGLTVTGNTFADNDVAGLVLEATSTGGPMSISGNVLRRNGFRAGGQVDPRGNPIADGMHVTSPLGAPVTISQNVTVHNAAYGIFAEPGTVVDGGGNRSIGDPAGCLGVVCA